VVRRQKDNVYCYLSHAGLIADKTVSAFVDSGASFNAIDPRVVKRLGLKVAECDKPLKLTIGNNQDVLVPRRITTLEVQLHGFPVYKTEAFVLPVPEGKHLLLGMPWLREVNPEIDWREYVIRDRGSTIGTNFHQCIREGTARVAGRARQKAAKKASPPGLAHDDMMLYYTKHVHTSKAGSTQVIASRELRKLKLTEGDFCFSVDIASEKAQRQLSTDWDALRGHPVEELVKKYKDMVFRAELPDTPPTRTIDVEAEIELTDESPVARKQFRLSAEVKEAVREWTREMLANNMIRPSKSPFSSPTFCVRKAVGWRIVHDFRAINARIRVPATPIPRKEDIYDAMANGRIFSAMDLLWGFFQVRLREQDIPYTAFSTPDGLFEYLVTPMGLSSSPSAFNRLIQTVFEDQREFCREYFDDLFVFTTTDSMEDHLAALDKVLARCAKQQLYVKLSKCPFWADEIACLGDYIGRNGIRMDPDKIKCIRDWPLPRTKRELQSFLGTCVYVLKYCPGFAALSAPLMEATKGKTKHERIALDEEQQRCFAELK
jgi:predicted aspartyl protease